MLILVGFGLLVFAWVDYARDETDIFVYGLRLGIERDDYPLLFWGLLLVQGAVGLGLLVTGLVKLL